MHVFGQHQRWVTRQKGEEHHLDCIEPQFIKLSQCMFWAAISGLKGKGRFIFWFIEYFPGLTCTRCISTSAEEVGKVYGRARLF